MKEVLEFLKKAGTYYLATVEGDQPSRNSSRVRGTPTASMKRRSPVCE